MDGALPFGSAARNPLWPEARWNLTGLFGHDWLILQVFSLIQERFGCRLRFDSVHGAPQVPWNCGRMSTVPVPTPDAMQSMVSTFNDMGIGVYFTFTNHLLEKTNLDHPACNMLLESIDNGRNLNGVILASDLLYDYISGRHPELKLTASIIKVTEEERRGDVDYYRSAQERFDSVMMHPDDGFDCDLLADLDRDKIEILVNEDCAFRCPNRINDYHVMASVIKAEIVNGPELEYACTRKKYCRAPQGRLVPTVRCCNFTTAEMLRVYELGFRRFKLQGRQNMPATFLFDLLRFSVDPELIAPIIFKSFVSGQATRQAAEAVKKVRAACLQAQQAGAGADSACDDEAGRGDSVAVVPMVVEVPKVKGHRLPTGLDGRHPLWPDARWTIGDLSFHGRVLRDVLNVLIKSFDYELNVDSAFAVLRAPWSGLTQAGAKLRVEGVAETARRFNGMDMGVRCVFNGPQITKADLDDETGNRILEVLDDGPGLNGVAVASDLLADHIRSRHPGLKLTASVARTTAEGRCGQADHYKSLAERFDTIVVCPQDGLDEDLLEQLDRDRIEIIVNEDAAWGAQAGPDNDRSSIPMARLTPDFRSYNFTTAELKRAYDLGCRRFQLRSSAASPNVFLYDVLRYILEPNLLLPVIFKSFTNDSAELNKRGGA